MDIQKDYPSENIEEIFRIAREALKLVQQHSTPPVPEVYEVWYRFVEGKHKPIIDQLNHAIHVAQNVSVQKLRELHDQFLVASEVVATSHKISHSLSVEVDGIHSILSSQQSAVNQFEGSVANAKDRLASPAVSTSEVYSCLGSVIEESELMQRRIAEMNLKLSTSKKQIDDLRLDLIELQKAVLTDPLTGLEIVALSKLR